MVVPGLKPVSEKEVTLAAKVKLVGEGNELELSRCKIKLSSLVELSIQVRLIWVEENGVAARLVGATIVPVEANCVPPFSNCRVRLATKKRPAVRPSIRQSANQE